MLDNFIKNPYFFNLKIMFILITVDNIKKIYIAIFFLFVKYVLYYKCFREKYKIFIYSLLSFNFFNVYIIWLYMIYCAFPLSPEI